MEHARVPMTPRLIDSLYTEAMLLADEARSYFDQSGREDRLRLDPLRRVGFSVESLKVTTRLMQIIAWLLTQRAAEAGELSQAQADADERRLGDAPASDPDVVEQLPESALQIVRASEDLFARVRRLNRSGRRDGTRASPARALMGRLERAF